MQSEPPSDLPTVDDGAPIAPGRATLPGGVSRVPGAPFSPRELADLLLEAGGAEIRAAFACGLVTGLAPVILVALQTATLDRPDRIAYWTASGLLLLALVAGLATFLDGATVRVAGGVGATARAAARHGRRLVGRAARRAVTWSLASPSQRAVAARLTTPHGMMAVVESGRGAPSRAAATTIRAATALARWAGRTVPAPPIQSPRERRVFAKSVAAQCATVFALLGATTAAVGWLR